ncbi:MAG: SWIM zinc finger family protein [Oscillatoria sp. PMC 1068.18]|nr:SWIM zinc finger family protein [Oscillatoria sp. PMC 1076.18]MEC4989125.1 SWIM zinc finger family protein [Oscillatoria sp. PMC 1068.18]
MTNYEMPSQEWWVLRWLELLDSYRFKKRLERGRNYAREGNVLNIEFAGSKVLAKVQGSEPEPYKVSLSLDAFSDEDWTYIVETMSEKAIYSAKLLAGEMPKNIEEVFIANGLSLFPFNLSEIHSRCTCPDKANPCKHIAAVYYQLGSRFSEDPFVFFQLRGRTKEEILESLRQLRSTKINNNPRNLSAGTAEKLTPKNNHKSVKIERQTALKVAEFWYYDEPLESSLVVVSPPPDNKTPIDFLGNIPLSVTDAQIIKQYLQDVYQQVSQQAIISALNSD